MPETSIVFRHHKLFNVNNFKLSGSISYNFLGTDGSAHHHTASLLYYTTHHRQESFVGRSVMQNISDLCVWNL